MQVVLMRRLQLVGFTGRWLLVGLLLVTGGVPALAHAQPTDQVPLEPPPPATQPPAMQEEPPAPPPVVALPLRPLPPADPALRRTVPRKQNNLHGLGFSASASTGWGFSYRRHFDNTAVQLNGIAVIWNRGQDTTLSVGGSLTQYLMVWHQGSNRSVMPASSALRLVAGGSYGLSFQPGNGPVRFEDPTCISGLNCQLVRESTEERSATAALGVGFEFGGVVQSGVSLTADLLLTAIFDNAEGWGLDRLLPLPQVSLMYSW